MFSTWGSGDVFLLLSHQNTQSVGSRCISRVDDSISQWLCLCVRGWNVTVPSACGQMLSKKYTAVQTSLQTPFYINMLGHEGGEQEYRLLEKKNIFKLAGLFQTQTAWLLDWDHTVFAALHRPCSTREVLMLDNVNRDVEVLVHLCYFISQGCHL